MTKISYPRLSKEFFIQSDVIELSQQLLGKRLVTNFEDQLTVGIIVETEAYRAPDDKASHAYQNRKTPRTAPMFEKGGIAYVYLCYGIHHLFNVVTGPAGVAHAILIRAIEPVEGIKDMLKRRKMTTLARRLTAGPGTAAQALGIRTQHTGTSLTNPDTEIWIEDPGKTISNDLIIASPRVGVAYAEECALWNWRFRIKDSTWTSLAK